MQVRRSHFVVVLGCFLLSGPFIAQEGHPLVGSWHGDRGATAATRVPVTLIMDWDGTEITGLVNPGYEHMALQSAKLNAKDWTVHFEVDSKDSSGKITRCIVDGKLDKLGSDRRTLTGTWQCGATKNDFKLTRDRDYYHTIGEPK
jgi:hypothetical protein